eukprot:2620754-Amphidinium_carterae.1
MRQDTLQRVKRNAVSAPLQQQHDRVCLSVAEAPRECRVYGGRPPYLPQVLFRHASSWSTLRSHDAVAKFARGFFL